MKKIEEMTPNDFLEFFKSLSVECNRKLSNLESFSCRYPELGDFHGGHAAFLQQMNWYLEALMVLFEDWKNLDSNYKKEWLSQVIFNYHSLSAGDNT